MALGRLSDAQQRVLVALAGMEPPWTLSGGAALAGIHTRHRETRDLDLFWQARERLDDLIDQSVRRLRGAGFDVVVLQTAEAFGRLDARVGTDSVIVDLVADPVPLAEPPTPTSLGSATILVDTPHQILVNKLCALLSRSELRDLVDVRALVDGGGDLSRAIRDCPRQDAGFSPLTFSWAIGGLAIRRLASALGWTEDRIAELETFRDALVARILADVRPES
jgi:hypothetical protein